MYELEQTQLDAVWATLNSELKVGVDYPVSQIIAPIASQGWAYRSTLEDIINATDNRLLDLFKGVDMEVLATSLGYPWRIVYSRPTSQSGSVIGTRGLAAADAAAFLIALECLGFYIDASPLVELLLSRVRTKSHLSDSELDVFRFLKYRHKRTITLQSNKSPDGFREVKRGKFPNGYKFECSLRDDDTVWALTVIGSKYRRRKDPIETICSDCGYIHWRGDPESSAHHRKEHKKRMRCIDPQPHALMIKELHRNTDAELVTTHSAIWKHREIFLRAQAFRREFGYDFPQWESPTGDNDANVHGYLFTNDRGAIVGACAFRQRATDTGQSLWSLQWVWVCRKARRTGVLVDRWPMFRKRFGDFFIEAPVSASMQAFLTKVGDTTLMK